VPRAARTSAKDTTSLVDRDGNLLAHERVSDDAAGLAALRQLDT
jgi:hypothetical protein